MDCLKTILGTNIAKDDFSLLGRQELDDNEKYFVTSVLSRFKKQFITKDDGVNNSEIILGFIKKYEHLFDKILAFSQMDLDEVITRAYIINEDRYYMFPACTLSFYLCFNYDKQPEQFTGKLVDLVIKACQRNPGFMLETIANLRIYKEGYSYFLLDGRGKYQIVIVLFAEEGRNPHAEQVEMLFDEKRYIISKSGICDNDVKYCTEKMAINNLIDGFSRNYTINYPKIKIQSEQKEFSLTPLVKIGF